MARGRNGSPSAGRTAEGARDRTARVAKLVTVPKVAVGTSPVHGRGLFAVVRLRRGAFIGRFEGTRTRRDGEHVLWVLDDRGGHYGLRGHNDLRFLNHSRHPNAEFHGAELYATRNIQPGSEIFIHYGDDWEDVE
ncbi:MAG: SET domain-containing protein [Myxococcota bacterium]